MPNACGRLRAAADCPSCDRSFRKQVSDRKVLPVPFDCRTYLVKMLRRQHCARSGEHQPDGTAAILHHHCDRSVGNDRPRIPVRSVAFGGDTGAAMLRFLLMPATPGLQWGAQRCDHHGCCQAEDQGWPGGPSTFRLSACMGHGMTCTD